MEKNESMFSPEVGEINMHAQTGLLLPQLLEGLGMSLRSPLYPHLRTSGHVCPVWESTWWNQRLLSHILDGRV